MLWCIVLAFFCGLINGQCEESNPQFSITTGLQEEADPVKWTLTVNKPIDDILYHIRFQNATDDSMNLEEDLPVSGDNLWWPCTKDGFDGWPENVLKTLFIGCNRFAPGNEPSKACYNVADMGSGVTWDEIQEGRMFWFLLEADPDTETYTLTSYLEVLYYSSSAGENVTTTEQTKEEGLTVTTLRDALNLDVPDLQVRTTFFQTTVPVGGSSTVNMKVELSNNKEVEWNMNLDEDPWFATDDSGISGATITKGSHDREWTISFTVDVCSVGTSTNFDLFKSLQDKSVRFEAYERVTVNLASLCASNHNIGTLPASATMSVYEDSALTSQATEFYLGDTLYINSVFTTFSSLSSITIESASLTQDSVETDITSSMVEVSSSTTAHSSSLTLTESIVSGSVEGITTTLSISYTLNYANTRRRLTKNYEVESFKQAITIKHSGCKHTNGLFAHPGEMEKISCSFSGYKVSECRNNHWEIIDESQCQLLWQKGSQSLLVLVFLFVVYFGFNRIDNLRKMA